MSETYDVIFRHATIVDGTGAPQFQGDIAIRGERIAAMGVVDGAARTEFDVAGQIVCPGFIDMHSHADLSILQYPLAENCLMQGCTTVVVGNCGMSPAPLGSYLPFGFESEWWFRRHPRSYGPPSFLPLAVYRQEFEEETSVELNWASLGEWMAKVEDVGVAVNLAPFVGHNTLRLAAMGEDSRRPARVAEIDRMVALIEAAMEEGAFGLSTGLDYMTGEYANHDEVVKLAKAAGRRGGLYFTHTRFTNNVYPSADMNEDPGLAIYHGPPEWIAFGRYRGLVEAVETARAAEVSTQIAHISNAFVVPQPHSDDLERSLVYATLEIMDRANAEGLDLHFDIIPNVTGPFNQPRLIVPFWKWLLLAGSVGQFMANLHMPEFRDELRRSISSGRFLLMMLNPATDPYWGDRTMIVRSNRSEFQDKTINQIARERGVDAVDALLDVVMDDPEAYYQNVIDIRTTPAGLPVFLRHPRAMIGLDHGVSALGWQIDDPLPEWHLPHPNHYGGFPHFISTYARDLGVLTLEEAIYKCTGLAAGKMRLLDRGVLREGAYADIVVFDYERLANRSTLLDPHHLPAGIRYVLVNGSLAYADGAFTGRRVGKVLRRPR